MSTESKLPITIEIQNRFKLHMTVDKQMAGWIKTKTGFDKMMAFLRMSTE